MLKRPLKEPARLFLWLALLLGVLYILITPPLQVPDEINHFLRAYQITQGEFMASQVENRLGGKLPASLREFSLIWERVIADTGATSSLQELQQALAIEIGSEQIWYDFPNTGIYSFVNYLPQAIGIILIRPFTSSVLVIYYSSRIISLTFWVILSFLAIQTIPGKKWTLFALAMLPMSLYINSSISADMPINALSMLWIAYVLKLLKQPVKLKNRDYLFLFLFAALIPHLKLVYLPLILMSLLLPTQRFNGARARVIVLALMAVVCTLSTWWSMMVVDNQYIPYEAYSKDAGWVHLAEGSDKNAQLAHIVKHPLAYGGVLVKSISESFNMWFKGYIGTFGWLEFGFPFWLCLLVWIALIFISLTDRDLKLSCRNIFWIMGILVLMLISVITSQYAIWVPVGGSMVTNLQGRYFIPVFLLLWLVIPARFNFNHVPGTSLMLVLGINLLSLIMIMNRFFIP